MPFDRSLSASQARAIASAFCVALALNLAVVAKADAQAPRPALPPAQDTTQWNGPQWIGYGSPPANATLPVPVVIAGMATPTRAADWQHYPLVEDCNAFFERSLRAAMAPFMRDTLRDTARASITPWTPLPPAVATVGRACLNRFPMATLSDTVLPSTLRLVIALDEDTLILPIVARQLAQARARGHADARAEQRVLEAAITLLLTNPERNDGSGIPHYSSSHLQLARAYTEQLDALGSVTLAERAGRRVLLLGPAKAAGDVPTERALRQELQQLLHGVPIDTTDLWYTKWDNDLQLAKLEYAQSLTHADLTRLATIVKTRDDLFLRVGQPAYAHAARFLGAPLPALSCHYTFDPAGAPGEGAARASLSGRSALFFYAREWTNTETLEQSLKALRRLHAAIPSLPITLVAEATEVFADRSFTGHPDQEAQLLHHYITDSLRAPGSVCIMNADTETVANGHVITGATPAAELFSQGPLFIADPTGVVVYNGGNIFNDASIEKPYGVDLVEFIRRLRATFSVSGGVER